MPIISIVMPSMNEEKTIGICIDKAMAVFKDYDVEGEIIVVDNSSDNTADIARSKGAIVIDSVKGYGNSYLTGFSHASGDYIAMADADNTYDFLEFPKLLNLLMENEADFVMGSRLRGTIKKGAMPFLHRYIGNPLLTKILNFSFKTNISDTHCGMRVFTREALEKMDLKTYGMEFASEMVIEAASKGLRIKEVPITYHAREDPSKLRSFIDGWRHLRFIFLYKPIPFLFIPGAFVFMLGLLLTTTMMMQGDVETKRMHSILLGSLLLIIGSQIISMALYMKAYGAVHGIYENDNGFIKKLLDYHSLEKEMLAGAILLGIGMILGIKVILIWINSGYGSLSEIETAILAMDFAAIGILMIFMSILLSVLMLDIKTD